VTTAALDNTGSIALKGSGADQALLDVTSSAGFGTAEVLSGHVRLVGDSAIEFAGGEITSLAANAQLHLNGSDAFVEDSSAPGSNSALTGLASIGAEAIFALRNKAAVSTTGSLVNDGQIRLDFESGDGGSSLTVGGTLTNSGDLWIGNGGIGAPDEVVAASLDNTGAIIVQAEESSSQALLDVTGAAGFGAAGVLSGDVELGLYSAIEFASGQITSLADGALLDLVGNTAFVEDSSALGSNSALNGLASIGAGATLELDSAASLTTGAIANSGNINVFGTSFTGSRLTLGALTNTGSISIGGAIGGTSQSGAALNVSGATTNDGSITIQDGAGTLTGPVGGTGSFSLSNADLLFDSSVSSGQTITETGANALTLNEAQSFAATIAGFGTGDTIDATNFHAPPATTFNFAENSGGTSGTLTLHDGSLTANILMTGDYSKSSFTLAPDSGTGTLVKFV
jgi:hypothetical protein